MAKAAFTYSDYSAPRLYSMTLLDKAKGMIWSKVVGESHGLKHFLEVAAFPADPPRSQLYFPAPPRSVSIPHSLQLRNIKRIPPSGFINQVTI